MKLKLTMNGVTVEAEAEEMPAFSKLAPDPSMDARFDHDMALHKGRRDYDKRMGIQAKHHITMGSEIDTTWIVDRVKDKIKDKTVVELGAGVGYLAVELAKHAKHVFAIEADVKWSWEFASKLYETKPRNLTWIFDRIENVVDVMNLYVEMAIVVTGSDEVWLRQLAEKMAPTVIMPWQDYNGGKAMISEYPLGLDG